MKGKFITFEGVDGAGKTVQSKMIAQWLNERWPTILTREPGGTEFGQHVKAVIDRSKNLNLITELLLFAADRAQHVDELIRPNLTQGKNVICDRYSDSTMAYQHYGNGIDKFQCMQTNYFSTNDLSPDLTIWIDIPVNLIPKRIFHRFDNNRFDTFSKEFFSRVQQGYSDIYKYNKDRVVKIEGNNNFMTVFNEIKCVIKTKFPSDSWETGKNIS